MKKTKAVKVAIVGSGLAGLTAAYLLSQERERDEDVELDVHLFEKMPSIGMDSSSISLPVPDTDDDWRVDVPMRSFQGGYYPQLIQLYKRLGVSFRKADFSYSFSHLSASPKPDAQTRNISARIIYNGYSGLRGISMPTWIRDIYLLRRKEGLFIGTAAWAWCYWLYTIMALQLLFCYLRLLWISVPIFRPRNIRRMSFRQWSEESIPRGFIAKSIGFDVVWRDFVSGMLVPLFSAVCTAGEDDVISHPMEEILDYIWLTLGTHHYTVENGVRDVVRRLSRCIKNVHLGVSISSIDSDPLDERLAKIACVQGGGNKVYEGFEHIIFATQATRAVPLLESYASSLPRHSKELVVVEEQIRCLKKFGYRSSIVINHTDETLLPESVGDRRDLNLICVGQSDCAFADAESGGGSVYCVSPAHTMATHILKRPTKYPSVVLQTTNPIISPRTDAILSVSKLERAVLTLESKEALEELYVEEPRGWRRSTERLGRLQGSGRLGRDGQKTGAEIWFCGAYACKGIPLLEGCVVSAQLVAEEIQRREGLRVLKGW